MNLSYCSLRSSGHLIYIIYKIVNSFHSSLFQMDTVLNSKWTTCINLAYVRLENRFRVGCFSCLSVPTHTALTLQPLKNKRSLLE